MKVAVVPVRSGLIPNGGLETISEADGNVVLIGDGVDQAIEAVSEYASAIVRAEAGSYAPGAFADGLAPHVDELDAVLLPASPYGRDMAPRLAAQLGWPLIANATEVKGQTIVVARHGGRVLQTLQIAGPYVATVLANSSVPQKLNQRPVINNLLMDFNFDLTVDNVTLAVLAPDPASLDLSEAKRIVAGGAGLGSQSSFYDLIEVADAIGASVGGTRVVMDWGWVPVDRQIGTTGVMTDPDLYIAVGISGAVQHTAGLGQPDHIIAVNSDPHCPMMAMADLAIVTDGPQYVQLLMEKLAGFSG